MNKVGHGFGSASGAESFGIQEAESCSGYRSGDFTGTVAAPTAAQRSFGRRRCAALNQVPSCGPRQRSRADALAALRAGGKLDLHAHVDRRDLLAGDHFPQCGSVRAAEHHRHCRAHVGDALGVRRDLPDSGTGHAVRRGDPYLQRTDAQCIGTPRAAMMKTSDTACTLTLMAVTSSCPHSQHSIRLAERNGAFDIAACTGIFGEDRGSNPLVGK